MRISDRYIGKQVLAGTLFAVLVLSVVLVLGNLFKEIRPLLVDTRAPLGLVVRFVLNVLPFSLMFTVPWGFLSAVLLVFGRLSSEQELTAFRVAGISLPRLAAPVFVIGALLSAGSFWLNVNVVPHAKATVRQLLYDQAVRDPGSLLKPGVVQGELSSDQTIKLLIEEKDGDWVRGFHLYRFGQDNQGRPVTSYVHASRAALKILHDSNQLRAKLENAYFEIQNGDGTLETGIAGHAEPLLIDLRDPSQRRAKASSMTNEEILDALARAKGLTLKERLKFHSELTKRSSFSLACLAFAFVAVPLGLTSRRKDTSTGLVLSLLIGTGYFLFTLIAGEFGSERAATIVLWTPNILCVLLGIWLFRRARFR
jgi:lipopolysaccharide export LptBFGC system permease protein LptF